MIFFRELQFFSFFQGMVTSLPTDFYNFLNELQKNLTRAIKSVGRIDHDFWRSFMNERKTEAMEGFIDGDLIETFLDLSREKMAEIANQTQIKDANGVHSQAKVEDLIKIVEDLTRIH